MVSISASSTASAFVPTTQRSTAPSPKAAGAEQIVRPEKPSQNRPAENERQSSQPSQLSKAQSSNSQTGQELTPEEQKIVRELQARDQEVRAHEQAHKTAGGPYASAPTYETVRGPDGRQYAVSGEVKIDASPENDPEDTIRKMEVVIRAALAPAQPSPQDRQVAQQARQTLIEARAELRDQRSEETGNNTEVSAFNERQNSPGVTLDQAIERFKKAEQAAQDGRNRAVEIQNNTDQIEISQEANEIINALFAGG